MLRHVVMWKLKESVEGSTRSECALKAKAMLEALGNVIPEIRSIEVGININHSDAAYDLLLWSEFDDMEALERYQKHPEHVKVAEYITKIRESRVVVDYIV